MSYSTSAPPILVSQGIAGGPRIWTYTSVDAATTANGSNYFSNGSALGMKVGDLIFGIDSDSSPPEGYILVVSSVTAGGAATADEYQTITT